MTAPRLWSSSSNHRSRIQLARGEKTRRLPSFLSSSGGLIVALTFTSRVSVGPGRHSTGTSFVRALFLLVRHVNNTITAKVTRGEVSIRV